MPVSAPEPPPPSAAARDVRLAGCPLDIIELSAFIAPAADARRRVAGLELPGFGRVVLAAAQLVLSVRPGRWLVLAPPQHPGDAGAQWVGACAAQGAVVELSSALDIVVLGGRCAREVLARGCRLDLDPAVFQTGSAAATIMAQVAVTLVALPAALLLLTPASTAQHLREWLTATARPFGLAAEPDLTFSDLCGDRWL